MKKLERQFLFGTALLLGFVVASPTLVQLSREGIWDWKQNPLKQQQEELKRQQEELAEKRRMIVGAWETLQPMKGKDASLKRIVFHPDGRWEDFKWDLKWDSVRKRYKASQFTGRFKEYTFQYSVNPSSEYSYRGRTGHHLVNIWSWDAMEAIRQRKLPSEYGYYKKLRIVISHESLEIGPPWPPPAVSTWMTWKRIPIEGSDTLENLQE